MATSSKAVNGKQNGSPPKKKAVVDESIQAVELGVFLMIANAGSKGVKLLWLVLFLTGLCVCIWQVYKSISNYIYQPIVSTYTIKTMPEIEFPIIYICPPSLVTNDFLNRTPSAEHTAFRLKNEMGTTWDYMEFLANGNLTDNFKVPENENHVIPRPFYGMTPKNRKIHNSTEGMGSPKSGQNSTRDVDPEVFFKNASVPLDMHLRFCQFRHFLYEGIPCKNITREVLDPEYGKCYVVDVGRQRTQTVQSQALYIVFHVQGGTFPQNSGLTPMFNGFVLRVENEFNVRGSGETIFLIPATYNRIDLAKQRQKFKSFNYPYVQRCVDDGDFTYEIFNVNYTQRSCGYECVARAMKSKCNCLPPIDRVLFKEGALNDTSRFCMRSDFECIRKNVHHDPEVQQKIMDCRSQCHVPCGAWRYDVKASSTDLYDPAMEGRPTPHLAYLFIAFRAMEYTKFTQDDSKTPDDLISALGGEIGLWVGASLLTALQAPISLLVMAFMWCCCRGKKETTEETAA